MELGKFTGKCYRCGKTGHKRVDCRVYLNKIKKSSGGAVVSKNAGGGRLNCAEAHEAVISNGQGQIN